MVLTDMKQILRLLAFLTFTLCFSCEGKVLFVNCEECFENEPVDALVNVRLRNINKPIGIKVYLGDLEDNVLYGIYQANGSEYTIKTGLNQKYTFTAEYNIEGITYIAVNSAFPQVKYEENQCENPCYFTYNNTVDLRLKNTFSKK